MKESLEKFRKNHWKKFGCEELLSFSLFYEEIFEGNPWIYLEGFKNGFLRASLKKSGRISRGLLDVKLRQLKKSMKKKSEEKFGEIVEGILNLWSFEESVEYFLRKFWEGFLEEFLQKLLDESLEEFLMGDGS